LNIDVKTTKQQQRRNNRFEFISRIAFGWFWLSYYLVVEACWLYTKWSWLLFI